jgi:hypothetical protein
METMNNSFKVIIWFDDKYGFIEYEEKNITVVLDDAEKKHEIEKYLDCDREIRVDGQHLLDFSPQTVCPKDSLANFKIALTRLWQETGVLICWSNPC